MTAQEIVIRKQAEIRTFGLGMKQGENSCGSEHWCCGGLAGRVCLCPVSPAIPPLLQHQWDISTQLLAGTSRAVSRKQNLELSPGPSSAPVFLLVTGAIIICYSGPEIEESWLPLYSISSSVQSRSSESVPVVSLQTVPSMSLYFESNHHPLLPHLFPSSFQSARKCT